MSRSTLVLRTAMVYGLLGPPIGGLVFWLMILFHSPALPTERAARTFWTSLAGIVVWSFLYGFIPACLTGAVAQWTLPTSWHWARAGLATAVVAAAVAMVYGVLVMGSPLHAGSALLFGLPGGVAGFALGAASRCHDARPATAQQTPP